MLTFIVLSILFASCCATPYLRIVNGTDAEAGEFPYIVSLRSSSKNHNCGASIISGNFILTAAHCVFGFSPSSLSVQYGVVDILADDTNSIEVEKYIVHERYAPLNGFRNDIAVLKLASSIPLSQLSQPIDLPKQEENFEAWSLVTLVGWGQPYSGGNVIDHLQKVDIYLYPYVECQEAHGSKFDEIRHVCAGVPEGGKGQCKGDSGGPLTVGNVQIGIVSWSVKPCTIAGYPGVFTRVANYVDWIKEKITTL